MKLLLDLKNRMAKREEGSDHRDFCPVDLDEIQSSESGSERYVGRGWNIKEVQEITEPNLC